MLMDRAHIHVATLANNHAMDYGLLGLFDTLTVLRGAGIRTLGVGDNLDAAAAPLIIDTAAGSVCLIAMSRTYPDKFWATATRAGTAFLSTPGIQKRVRSCSEKYAYTFILVHWGEELNPVPSGYQKEIARAVIEAGATAIIGHHPHVLQSIDFINDRPIIYSVGNFIFTTRPVSADQQGMAVRIRLGPSGSLSHFELVPLLVNNNKVKFHPRPLARGEADPIKKILPAQHPCKWQDKNQSWLCRL